MDFAEPGDLLRYVYDYGDEWAHVLKLEKVSPEPCLHPRVLTGKHEAPKEDLIDWAADLGKHEPCW